MRNDVRRRHAAYLRASRVIEEHGALFDATPGGKEARTTLADHVASVTDLLAAQEKVTADAKTAAEEGRQARVRLREAVRGIVTLGKFTSRDEAVMSPVRLPGAFSDQELLAYARGLLKRVAEHPDAFGPGGLPPAMLKSLEDAIQALEDARAQQAEAHQRFGGALQAMLDTLDKCKASIAALDGIALNTPDARPVVLTKLRRAKRVGPRKADDTSPAHPPAEARPASPTPSSGPPKKEVA